MVADPQATLQHRGAGALARIQHIEGLCVELLVVAQVAIFAGALLVVLAGGASVWLLRVNYAEVERENQDQE